MPENTVGSGQVPSTNPATPSADDGARPVVTAMPPSSSTVRLQEGENTDFERKYNSLRGEWKAKEAQWESYCGQLEAKIEILNRQLAQTQGRASELETGKTQLEQQVAGLPTIQQRASLADDLEEQIVKLRYVTQFPEIVGQVEITEVEENGQKVSKRENSVLDMLLSSTLKGPAFQEHVGKLAKKLGTPHGEQKSGPVLEAGMTSPPMPTSSNLLDEIDKQIWEARNAGDYKLVNELLDKKVEAKYKKP